jgi:hypothetical protein
MARSEEEIEELFGRQFAVEAMLTHVWAWAKAQPHPPSALAGYLRPLEEGMDQMANQSPRSAAMQAAQATVRQIAEELERTLHRQVVLRAGGEGPVQ